MAMNSKIVETIFLKVAGLCFKLKPMGDCLLIGF
jgi:hypothetical protein